MVAPGWYGNPPQEYVGRAAVPSSIPLMYGSSVGALYHLPDTVNQGMVDLASSTMYTAAGSASMASTQPIMHLLQTQTSMQPALPSAGTSISTSRTTSTISPQQVQQLVLVQPLQQQQLGRMQSLQQQQHQLVLAQPQSSQMLLLQQQPVLQGPPWVPATGPGEQHTRPQLRPLDDQILQQYKASTLFYAGVLPIATDEGLLGVFEQFGTVISLEQFRPYAGSKASKVGGRMGERGCAGGHCRCVDG